MDRLNFIWFEFVRHAYNAIRLNNQTQQGLLARNRVADSNGGNNGHSNGNGHAHGNGHGTAKLNLFQRLVRQWETLHPYNGAQVLKIRGQVDLDLARAAWHDAMEVLGLGRVCLSGDSYRYQCLNGDAIHHTVRLCPPGTVLDEWISGEMNRRFDELDAVPFRPFVIQEDGHFWLGLVYQHWVADSSSIRLLMHEWFARQFDPAAASTQRVRTRAGGYLALFGPHLSGWHTGEAFLSALRWQSQFRRARRIEDGEVFRDLSVRFARFPTEVGMIDGLVAAARTNDCTVNDLFLAAIAQACDQHIPAPRRYRRQDLAIATIVDLRSKSPTPLNNVFDLLLGFTSVCCRPEQMKDWKTLLHAVSLQTRRQKATGAPQSSWLRMLGALAAGRLLAQERVTEFYRKRVSLAGANSNVNLNRCWASRYNPDPLMEYVRVAPTGPMTPLVFTTTTLGHGLSIGLTYRNAIVSEERVRGLATVFLGQLNQLAFGDSVNTVQAIN
ncbi:MAG: hypothetical protein M3O30_07655 [Planctomycetota bacterium]|nr:hypothetical protein [Planctomycetota bacterium]